MVQEVLPNLFRMEIPIPRNPLKALNSYLIKTPERNLIIDTCMNRPECRQVTDQVLADLGVDLRKTDFFITHLHADHCGLVGYLAKPTSRIYCSEIDAKTINAFIVSRQHWDNMLDFARRNGFPEPESQEALARHPGYLFSPTSHLEFTLAAEGTLIEIGDYRFQCVATPGHTQGHMCLYDPQQKLLIAGDHILGDITPNISQWTDEHNCLRDYLRSLDKIKELAVDLVLPGHRSLITDCRGRIEELKKHHQFRLDEVLSILARGTQNAYQVAARMTWDMTYKDWDMFPPPQKWFAAGEALAHLQYLEAAGMIKREVNGQQITFSLL